MVRAPHRDWFSLDRRLLVSQFSRDFYAGATRSFHFTNTKQLMGTLTLDVKTTSKLGESRQLACDSYSAQDIIIMQPQRQKQQQEEQQSSEFPEQTQQLPHHQMNSSSSSCSDSTCSTEEVMPRKSPMHLDHHDSVSNRVFEVNPSTLLKLALRDEGSRNVKEHSPSPTSVVDKQPFSEEEEHRQEVDENGKGSEGSSIDSNDSISQTTPTERRDSHASSVAIIECTGDDETTADREGADGFQATKKQGSVPRVDNKQENDGEETIPSMSLAMKLLEKRVGESISKSCRDVTATPMRLGFMLRRRCGSSGDIPRCRFDDEDDEEEEDNSMGGLWSKDRFPTFQEATGLRRRFQQFAERKFQQQRPALGEKRSSMRRSKYTRPSESQGLIPAEHPWKVVWDVLTVILSLANAYVTHTRIRDRKFGSRSPFAAFCDVWFVLDILLNFVTERKISDGVVLRDFQSVWARYLTSWFAIDALSLVPWERFYVKPIIDKQRSRGFFQKYFFRSKAVVRVTTHLRGRHFRWFGNVAKHTKPHLGVGSHRLLRLIIKYAPKYVLFLRNMKGAVAVRVLRQVHWFRRFFKNTTGAAIKDDKHRRHFVKNRRHSNERDDSDTGSLTGDDDVDDLDENFSKSSMSFGDSRHATAGVGGKRVVEVVYDNWEYVDDDEDDVPF